MLNSENIQATKIYKSTGEFEKIIGINKNEGVDIYIMDNKLGIANEILSEFKKNIKITDNEIQKCNNRKKILVKICIWIFCLIPFIYVILIYMYNIFLHFKHIS